MTFLRLFAHNFTPLISRRASFLALCAALVPPVATHGQTLDTSVAEERESTTLPEVVVVAETPGYLPQTWTTSTRIQLPVMETPRSVQVFSREVIDDLNPATIEDIVTRSANVVFLGDNDGRENTFIIRGFEGAPVLRDGFRLESFGGIMDPEIYGLERIEVLKGPDSILYGEANPGGLINLVSKRPLKQRQLEMELEVGSFGSTSPRFDIGGPLFGYGALAGDGKNPPIYSDRGVHYRLVGLYRYDEGFRDYFGANHRFYLAPSVTIDFSARTSLTLLAYLTYDDNYADFGIGLSAQGDIVAPVGRVNNHPQDRLERGNYIVGYDLRHELGGGWTVENRLRYVYSNYEYSAILLPLSFDATTGIYDRAPAFQYQNNQEIATQLNLSGDHEIGGFRNRLFAGFDFRFSTVENFTRFDPVNLVPINYYSPNYAVFPPSIGDIPVFTGGYQNDEITRYGVYLQNHFNITKNLIISGGVRYDDVDRKPTGESGVPNHEQAWSFQAGIVYEITDSLSVYGSYSESFNPNFGVDINGLPLEAETGEGFDVGIKATLLDERLFVSACYFYINKYNIATADINDPAFPFGASIAVGEQRSQGFEFEVAGQITPSLSVLGSYGFTDAEVVEDTTLPRGNQLVGVPAHTAALWAKYEFQNGVLRGFGIGAGFQYVGERVVDAANTAYVDACLILNAALYYRRDNWEVQVNFNNFTDEEYVVAASGDTARSVHAGAPFYAVGVVRVRF